MAPGEEEAACRLSEQEESAMRARRPADNQEETACAHGYITHTYARGVHVYISNMYIYTHHT